MAKKKQAVHTPLLHANDERLFCGSPGEIALCLEAVTCPQCLASFEASKRRKVTYHVIYHMGNEPSCGARGEPSGDIVNPVNCKACLEDFERTFSDRLFGTSMGEEDTLP